MGVFLLPLQKSLEVGKLLRVWEAEVEQAARLRIVELGREFVVVAEDADRITQLVLYIGTKQQAEQLVTRINLAVEYGMIEFKKGTYAAVQSTLV